MVRREKRKAGGGGLRSKGCTNAGWAPRERSAAKEVRSSWPEAAGEQKGDAGGGLGREEDLKRKEYNNNRRKEERYLGEDGLYEGKIGESLGVRRRDKAKRREKNAT